MSECSYCQNTFEMQDTCSDEFRMWQGLQGPYYIPTVDEEGVLSWTNTGGLPNPDPVDITGPAGSDFSIAGIVETVSDLPQSAEGVWLVGEDAPYDGYTYIDSWEFIGQFAIGPEGPQGETGASAGFGTPTATVDSSTGTPSVTVTASGPDTAKVFSFAFHNLKGDSGQGVPTGGTAGQVLAKASGTDYDTEWVDQSGGGGTVQSVNNVTPDQSGNITLTADDIGTDATNISIQDALDGYVHVGTSAPTDPTTKIWLDTDEPGMSGVSSVNGATGTVVLDADDVGASPEWELVWTNASPGSSFGGQKVPLDLTGRTQAKIVFCEIDSGYVHPPYVGLFDLTGSYGVMFSYRGYYESSTTYLEGRRFTIASDGITFDNGTYEEFKGSAQSATVNNGMVIPYKIFVR